MGADLYRRWKSEPKKEVKIMGFERSNRAIEAGYFRDAYNDGSILMQYGLSWWRDIAKLQNKDGIITPAKVKKFRQMITDKQSVFDENVLNKPDEAYFMEGARLLKEYLDGIIEAGDSISASL